MQKRGVSAVAVLAAALTFSVPLLRLTGRWAFWPVETQKPDAEPVPVRQNLLRRLLAGRWLPDIWKHAGPVLLRNPDDHPRNLAD